MRLPRGRRVERSRRGANAGIRTVRGRGRATQSTKRPPAAPTPHHRPLPPAQSRGGSLPGRPTHPRSGLRIALTLRRPAPRAAKPAFGVRRALCSACAPGLVFFRRTAAPRQAWRARFGAAPAQGCGTSQTKARGAGLGANSRLISADRADLGPERRAAQLPRWRSVCGYRVPCGFSPTHTQCVLGWVAGAKIRPAAHPLASAPGGRRWACIYTSHVGRRKYTPAPAATTSGMAPAVARACAWALLAALLWLPPAGATRRADSAESILAERCRGNLLLADRPQHEEAAPGLAGIFIRGRCSPPEAALWYEDTGETYWANPYAVARGLAEDIRRVLADTPVYRDLAIQVLNSAFGLPHEVRAPLPPPPRGCVLPPRYHTTGPCGPGDGIYR